MDMRVGPKRRLSAKESMLSDYGIYNHIYNHEYSLEGLMLKLQYFGHMMQKANSFEKTVMLGKLKAEGGGDDRMRWLDGITDSMNMNLRKLGDSGGERSLACCSSRCCKESDMTEQLNNNTYINIYIHMSLYTFYYCRVSSKVCVCVCVCIYIYIYIYINKCIYS